MNPHPIKLLLFLSLVTCVQAQIEITGVTDESVYADQVSFTIENRDGHSYDARLDGKPVPVGLPVLVTEVDYHELSVFQTNDTTQVVGSELVQFIIRASERGATENGLPPHTPYPLIHSSDAEFAGAQLQVMVPAGYPQGMEIPVVAWVRNASNHAVRVNGIVTAPNQASFTLFRGVGSGFLEGTNASGELDYFPKVGGLSTNRRILVESNTVWTSVGGTLSGNIDWPEDSRMAITNHLVLTSGTTLTIGAGSIVRVGPGVDITNSAEVVINGTVDRPVVFAPISNDQPWGGFTMRDSNGSVVGKGVIFTGSGADPNWYGSGGNPGSHRTEQGLFFCGGDNTLTLTDAAAISLAGQLGHSVVGSDITLTRFLLQRATTGGEYTAARFSVNDSAFIEFPRDSPEFEDGDHDAIYIVSGTHGFTNTLFGWTKDDGVDSGAGGAGLLDFQSCWFESILHEGNSLSGNGKIVNHRHDVFLNCGQGLESGYDGPQGLLEDCLLLDNKTGGRFGDNYDWAYTGRLSATNSLFLHNYRDVWGMNWEDWTWRTNRMLITSNWFTRPIPEHPENRIWDPVTDAWRLTAFQNTPHSAPVGIGLAVHKTRSDFADLETGIPVRLSSFTTNTVEVDYTIQTSVSVLASGTIKFKPGETVVTVPAPTSLPGGTSLVRVQLLNPVHGELTHVREAWFMAAPAAMISEGAIWRYLDTGTNAGMAWLHPNYDDSAWPTGSAELGYGEGDESTVISFGADSGNKHITTYFRHAFTVSYPESVGGLTLRLKRDDGAIVYLNGREIFRSSITNGAVDYLTRAFEASDDGKSWHSTNVPPSALQSGTNVLAVEVHQVSPTSSDVSFDLELTGVPLPVIESDWFGNDWVLHWQDETYTLESAPEATGPWTSLGTSDPTAVDLFGSQQFFRLRKP